MKRYSQRSGHTAMAELNVTPLLDLAFVLLIIFIITTPLLTSNIQVQLPSASNNHVPPPDAKSLKTIAIDRSGQIYLDDQKIEIPVLQQQLSTFHDATPDAAVIIHADKSINVQQLLEVMDAVQQAKIDKLGIDHTMP